MTVDVQQDLRLLRNHAFRRLLESRLAGQTAQNAMIYAVLILLVEETGSAVNTTILVAALTLPSIVLGIPGGTLADILPRRLSLTFGYLARAAVAVALVYYSGDLAYIYLVVVIYATVGQLFGPAEAATVPAIVRRDQLSLANSLMVLALIGGQIAGMVVLAPVLIKLLTPDAVFVVACVLYLVAAYIVGWLARGFTPARTGREQGTGFIAAMRQGFQILRTNRRAYLAVVYMVTTFALSKVLVILLPKYTREVLSIAAEDTVFVAAPAAIGAGVGLLLAPILTRLFGAWRVVVASFFFFLLGLIGLGFVVYVRDFILQNFDIGIGFVEDEVGVSSVITATMLLAIPLGLAFTLISIAGRVVMNEQAPQEAQGRVFAVQMAIGDALSLLPLLLVGVMADGVGVRATLLASAASALLVTGYLTISRRFGPRGFAAQAEPAPHPG